MSGANVSSRLNNGCPLPETKHPRVSGCQSESQRSRSITCHRGSIMRVPILLIYATTILAGPLAYQHIWIAQSSHGTVLFWFPFGRKPQQGLLCTVREALSNNDRGARQSTPTDKAFLTVKQAAAYSGLRCSTILLLIRKRQLGAQKVRRRVLIKRTDLERFLEANPIRVLTE